MAEPKTSGKLRIAVTGFNGFIGSCFVKRLRSLNVPVICLKGDVRSTATWKEDFDVLYHFAAKMPADFVASPHEAFSVNLDGVLNALEACRRNKAQMVLSSTCGVYKPTQRKSLTEEATLGPSTAYAQSKLLGELLCRSYAQHYGVKSAVLRLFNVYGPKQEGSYIIPYLVKCVLENSPAKVAHPTSSRDFIHVRDVIDSFLLAPRIKEPFAVYNIGSGRSYTIAQVIELISDLCKRKIQYKKIKSAIDPNPFVCANSTRFSRDMGWGAKVNLKDGIQEVINDFQGVGNRDDF